MTANFTPLLRAAAFIAALALPPLLVSAAPMPAIQPAWDINRTLPCGGMGIERLDPSKMQSAIVRWDTADHKSLTVVVFLDAQKLEQDGHSERFHYSTTAGPLSYRISATDVTVWAAACPIGLRVEPTPVPSPWQHNLVVPCGADPELAYNRAFGFGITWVGPAQDKLIFDAWQDSGHVAASGRDIRTTVTTDHAFAGCKLYWTDNAPSRYTVSFFARLPNTGAPAQGE